MTLRALLSITAACAAALLTSPGELPWQRTVVVAQAQSTVPEYRVDPSWPKELSQNWLLGGVSGVAVDEQDHVWIVHRPRVLTEPKQQPGQGPPANQLTTCCVPAPAVVEFDPEGKVVNAWGGKSLEGNKWPASEHSIHVDRQKNVWLTDEGRFFPEREGGNVAQKYSRDGKLLLQIGQYGIPPKDNSDIERLGSASAITVDDAANEVYVGEAHGGRRLLVFDATTGAFKRQLFAYGGSSIGNGPAPRFDPAGPPPREFAEVHCARLSREGLVYVCDRRNNRIQVLRKDGTFVEEIVFAKDGKALVAPWDLAFSVDRDQRYMLVADGVNQKVWVVQRKPLQLLGSFGRAGRRAGDFLFPNAVAFDSKGNLFVGEVTTGDRIQKFVPTSPDAGRRR